MKISYGPAGSSGVTHLMAVGADEHELGQADRAIHRGFAGAAIAIAAGYLLKMPRVQTAGIGAVIALGLVHYAARRTQVVQLSTPTK